MEGINWRQIVFTNEERIKKTFVDAYRAASFMAWTEGQGITRQRVVLYKDGSVIHDHFEPGERLASEDDGDSVCIASIPWGTHDPALMDAWGMFCWNDLLQWALRNDPTAAPVL